MFLYEEEHEGEEIVLNTKQIVQENLTYLPLTLQYTVKSVDDEYDQINHNQSDSITFTVNGQTMSTLKSLDIYGKRLIIEYEPETESDKAVIKKYGSIFDVPAYLVKMVPTLKLDGETEGTGPAVSLGNMQTLQMNVYSEGGTSVVTNKITAGSIYQITEDMQCISPAELSKAINEATSISHSVSLDNVYSDEYLGRMLDLAGKLYYAQVDAANISLAEKDNISLTRSLSVGMTGYSVQTSVMFGMPVGINEGRLYIDIDLNNIAAVSRTGNDDDTYRFAVTSGVASSCYEGVVWSELTGEDGVSTMSLLETAQQEGQSVLMLSSANYAQNRDKLNADSATISAVEQAINSGKIVTIHTDKITVDDWSGFGYIVTTPSTGGSSYMISGGLNGGAMTFFVSIAYLLNIALTLIDMAEILCMALNALTLILVGWGTIAVIPGLLLGALSIVMMALAIIDYVMSIKLMADYLSGDIVAGAEVIFGAGLNIIFTAGIKAVGYGVKKLVKGIAEKVAAKTIGVELAEQVIKNSDHPIKITRALRQLGKAGISDDIIRHILDTGGEEALERFGKWAKKGLPSDILENIAKNAADYARYTDDVIDKIMKSDGYVDDIIRCINQHGDNAAKAIGKCGDDAAVLISEYGDNAAKHISEYGDEAVEILYDSGKNGLKALDNGIDPKTIKNLAEQMDISPESFEARGIINNKAANQVLNSRFTAKAISSIASFTDSCETIIRNAGFNSVEEFKSLSMNTYEELVKNGRLADIQAVRNAIPDPTNQTVMQKVINPDYLDSYFSLSGYSDRISGSMAKFSDVQNLTSYADIYNGLRLDYTGSPFLEPGIDENSVMYAIRFTTDQFDNINISYGLEELGTSA